MNNFFINSIINNIQTDFTNIYKNASGFVDTPLFEQCILVIGNTTYLQEIVTENDNGIPPVQTLLKLFEERGYKASEISDIDSICMGELMAFVFKHIFKYKNQKDNVPIKNNFGVKTATTYYDRQEFEILEG